TPPLNARVRYVTWTLGPHAATAGVKWSTPLFGPSPLTTSIGRQKTPSLADRDITTSFVPSLRNRASCHTTYRAPLCGSTPADGNPPVRMSGGPLPSKLSIVVGSVHDFPPSFDSADTSSSEPVPKSSHTITTWPFGSTSGSAPTPVEPGSEMRSLHDWPWSSE